MSSTTLFLLLLTGTAVLSTDSQDPTPIVLNQGDELSFTVITFHTYIVGCDLTTPTGRTISFLPEDNSPDRYELRPANALTSCNVIVKDFTVSDNGVWALKATGVDGAIQLVSFDVTIKVDGSEETTPVTMELIDLDTQNIKTSQGDAIYIRIPLEGLKETESCYLQTPDGTEYKDSDIDSLGGIKLLRESLVSCGVMMIVNREEYLGQWILTAQESTMGSDPIKRRLRFNVMIENSVASIPNGYMKTRSGNDFYFRLEKETDLASTCTLSGPTNDQSRIERDPAYVNNCGFIVRRLTTADSGRWEIHFGNTISNVAAVDLFVTGTAASFLTQTISVLANRHDSINQVLSPGNTVYCRLLDPRDVVVYEGFGPCQLSIPRADYEHIGLWEMDYALIGNVLTIKNMVIVNVREAAAKPTVTTSVSKENKEVYMTCSVTTLEEPKPCKFRSPSGSIMIAAVGAGQDRYTYHGSGVSMVNGMYQQNCGIRITEPAASDLGIWRCGIDTETNSYYGFLTVDCPWAMQDPNVAAAVASGEITMKPELAAGKDLETAVEGDEVILRCSIQSPIRYCHFRSSRGDVFPVGPATSSLRYEYAGAGFDAGECFIKFHSLSARDSGSWSCHAGLPNSHEEQRADFQVSVQEKMTVNQYEDGSALVVEGLAYKGHSLEYCRFIRIDGNSFTNEQLPQGVTFRGALSSGVCGIRFTSPNVLDHHPWTVVAKIVNHDEEIFSVTSHSLSAPEDDVPHALEDVMALPPPPPASSGKMHLFYCIFLPIGLLIAIASIVMISKSGKTWTTNKIRPSFNGPNDQDYYPEKHVVVIDEKKAPSMNA